MPQLWQALSIRQPWAALIVHGLKTIEVRSWMTGKRGPILIHAAKRPDPDPAAWRWIATPELMTTASLSGGVIGIVELTDCITYSTAEAYAADAERHCTAASRWRPGLYGFSLARARRVCFVPWPGNTNFFSVRMDLKPVRRIPRARRPTNTLVVRLPEESP